MITTIYSTIQICDSFRDWNTVQCIVDIYAKKHGFVANKYHKDFDTIDKSIIQCHDYNCWKSGINKLKKLKIYVSILGKIDFIHNWC